MVAVFKDLVRSEFSSLQSRGIGESGLTESEYRVINVVTKADPAVVSIVVKKKVPIVERYFESYSDTLDNGSRVIVRVPKERSKGEVLKEIGGGSGFIVTSTGLVVTNKHVVSDTSALFEVYTSTGKKYEAKVVAEDSFVDIALLKIENVTDMPYITFGDSSKLVRGQTVIAIGNALNEFRNSVSVGVVSGLSRSLVAGDASGNSEQLDEVIQTDAAINPGNSGGPLLNTRGEVIGVNVAVAKGSENIGFALPSNAVRQIVDSVLLTGEIVRPFVGIRYVQIDSEVQVRYGLERDFGIYITRGQSGADNGVVADSPAQKAGIREGDIITHIDGVKLTGDKSFGSIIRSKNPGQTVRLTVVTGKEERDIELVLDRAPKDLVK